MDRATQRPASQSGFSMVEMLMVAFVLAFGILGVAALQVMALRATSGSQNLSTAALVADRILDQVEAEARLTWLNQTSTTVAAAGTEPPALYYLANVPPFTLAAQTFDVNGTPLAAGAPNAIFSAVVSGAPVTTAGASTGALLDVNVTVTFADTVQNGKTLTRSLTLSRRFLHA